MTNTSRSHLEEIGSFLECATLNERDDFCRLLSLACLGEHYDERDSEAVKAAFEVLAAFPGRDEFTAMKAKAEAYDRAKRLCVDGSDTMLVLSWTLAMLIDGDRLRARVAELEATIAEAEAMLPADAEAATFAKCMLQAVARLKASEARVAELEGQTYQAGLYAMAMGWVAK